MELEQSSNLYQASSEISDVRLNFWTDSFGNDYDLSLLARPETSPYVLQEKSPELSKFSYQYFFNVGGAGLSLKNSMCDFGETLPDDSTVYAYE